jgi:hypothetical protein
LASSLQGVSYPAPDTLARDEPRSPRLTPHRLSLRQGGASAVPSRRTLQLVPSECGPLKQEFGVSRLTPLHRALQGRPCGTAMRSRRREAARCRPVPAKDSACRNGDPLVPKSSAARRRRRPPDQSGSSELGHRMSGCRPFVRRLLASGGPGTVVVHLGRTTTRRQAQRLRIYGETLGSTAIASIETSSPRGNRTSAGAERAGGGSGMCRA